MVIFTPFLISINPPPKIICQGHCVVKARTVLALDQEGVLFSCKDSLSFVPYCRILVISEWDRLQKEQQIGVLHCQCWFWWLLIVGGKKLLIFASASNLNASFQSYDVAVRVFITVKSPSLLLPLCKFFTTYYEEGGKMCVIQDLAHHILQWFALAFP